MIVVVVAAAVRAIDPEPAGVSEPLPKLRV
jgi:hypothetical protein